MPNLSYLSPKTAVKASPIHGRGLFAIAPICQGELVAIKGGYIFTRQQWQALEPTLGPADIPIADGFYIGPHSMPEREGNMIFSNHSCEPNIGVQGQIVFVALRDIQAGEELTHDWAMTDDDIDEMVCHCGAPTCRGIVTGQDWRRKELQEKYGQYMSWYLLEKIKETS
jgi:SET domain-containing protein